MTEDGSLAHVLNRTASIENLMDQVILAHIGPREGAWQFCWSVLLDSSVVHLGGKVKVVAAVANVWEFELVTGPLLRLLSLRNAFAHHATDPHITVFVAKDPEESEVHSTLHILKANGKLEKMRRMDAVAEFDRIYGQAKESLLELRDLVKGRA